MKKNTRILIGGLLLAVGLACDAEEGYQPTWESLDTRAVPQWFSDARFGIFIHWGVYSVPSWAPKGKYAEWYWAQMRNDKPDGPWKSFHADVYGKDYPYEQFAPDFTAEMFNPKQWAELFQKAGARYVVLTSKHHDGYCLWPAPVSKGWNSVDVGPGRDLLDELSSAVRDEGIRMGYYYSLHNWYDKDYAPADPKGTRNIDAYVQRVMLPQMKDLVEKYKPALLFADGEWTAPAEDFRSQEFLAWLFNDSAAPEDVVINDRWGAKTRSRHGGYYTTEYGKVDIKGTRLAAEKPWEECRGIGGSFGYSRNEAVEDYLTRRQVVHLLIDIVSRGGNLLLNVGPTADGRIPPIMEDRLLAIGRWLEVNGEAVYGTEKWKVSGEGPTPRDQSIASAVSATEAVDYTGRDIRYTQSKDGKTLYAIALGIPPANLVLNSVRVDDSKAGRVELLGSTEKIPFTVNQQGVLELNIPTTAIMNHPTRYAYTFKLSGFE